MDNRQLVFELFKAFKDHELEELEFSQGNLQLKLKKASENGLIHPVQHIPLNSPNSSESPVAEVKNSTEETLTINSPMVGTFYRAPAPDAPAFIEEGQEVASDQTICIIEAMKQMNQLEADYPCRIVRILVENSQLVEFGQPLFEVERL